MKTPFSTTCLAFVSVVLALTSAQAQRSFSAAPSNVNPFAQPQTVTPQATPVPVAPGMYNSPYTTAAAPVSSEPIDPNHKLGRGDRLSYRVVEDRDNGTLLTVTDSGDVDLPLPNLRVHAAGRTTDELRSVIKAQLEQKYYKHATVDVGLVSAAVKPDRGAVYVNGAVKNPSMLRLPADAPLTVSQAIAQAGGPVSFSYLKKVIVVRKGAPQGKIVVDVGAVLKGKYELDVALEPGDIVQVPEKTVVF